MQDADLAMQLTWAMLFLMLASVVAAMIFGPQKGRYRGLDEAHERTEPLIDAWWQEQDLEWYEAERRRLAIGVAIESMLTGNRADLYKLAQLLAAAIETERLMLKEPKLYDYRLLLKTRKKIKLFSEDILMFNVRPEAIHGAIRPK